MQYLHPASCICILHYVRIPRRAPCAQYVLGSEAGFGETAEWPSAVGVEVVKQPCLTHAAVILVLVLWRSFIEEGARGRS